MIGDPPEEIYYQNPGELVSDLKRYLPVAIRELKDPIEKASTRAQMQQTIGNLAHSAGLFKDAETFLRDSSRGFQRLGMRAQEIGALQSLKATYLAQNKKAAAKKISQMLDRI